MNEFDESSDGSGVIQFILHEVPPPHPAPISKDTDLRSDFRMLWEDAETLMVRFFREFGVDPTGFDFDRYFPTERFRLFAKRSPPPTRLTIGLLEEAVAAGHWTDRAPNGASEEGR